MCGVDETGLHRLLGRRGDVRAGELVLSRHAGTNRDGRDMEKYGTLCVVLWYNPTLLLWCRITITLVYTDVLITVYRLYVYSYRRVNRMILMTQATFDTIYMKVNETVPDPAWFTPPPYCLKQTAV